MPKGSLWSLGGAAAAATILGAYSLTHRDDNPSSSSGSEDRRKRRDRRSKKDRQASKAQTKPKTESKRAAQGAQMPPSDVHDRSRKHRKSKQHQPVDDGRLHGSSSDDSEIPTITKHRKVQRRISYDVGPETSPSGGMYSTSSPRVYFGKPPKKHKERREDLDGSKRKHRKSDKYAQEDPRVRHMREADARAARQPAKQVHFKSPSPSPSSRGSSSEESTSSTTTNAAFDAGHARNSQEPSQRSRRHAFSGQPAARVRSRSDGTSHTGYAGYAGVMEDTPSESSSEPDWTIPAVPIVIPTPREQKRPSRQPSSSSSFSSVSSSTSDPEPAQAPAPIAHKVGRRESSSHRSRSRRDGSRQTQTPKQPAQPSKTAQAKSSSSSSSSSTSSSSASDSVKMSASEHATRRKPTASRSHDSATPNFASLLSGSSSSTARRRPPHRSRRGSHRTMPSPSSTRKAAPKEEASKVSTDSTEQNMPMRPKPATVRSVSDLSGEASSRRSSESVSSAPALPTIPALDRTITFDGLPIPPKPE